MKTKKIWPDYDRKQYADNIEYTTHIIVKNGGDEYYMCVRLGVHISYPNSLLKFNRVVDRELTKTYKDIIEDEKSSGESFLIPINNSK